MCVGVHSADFPAPSSASREYTLHGTPVNCKIPSTAAAAPATANNAFAASTTREANRNGKNFFTLPRYSPATLLAIPNPPRPRGAHHRFARLAPCPDCMVFQLRKTVEMPRWVA